ncbi:3-dehydroquinate synthase [Sphingomonas sp. ASV193]|uniref:3-dehydroquinate synthase n=1 Tax=Sphingomonas sp. ASV193 TaxID=3144405 RepID=UPI0032E8A794
MTRIRVGEGPAGYDVRVGPLAAGLEDLRVPGRLAVVSDERVWGLHGPAIRDRFDTVPLLVPDGEEAKDWPVLHELLRRLAELDPDRATPLLALGGGSVGDLAGLAAALFKRGIPVVHVPTTLLAQADSAVGGKTAIDFAGQKNLVGTFHAPALVLADPALLATLDSRQMRSGFAEVVKYGVIDDAGFFAWLEDHGGDVLGGHADHLAHAVATSIRAKARMVTGDERDLKGQRALLNLGHSFGHAIEAEAGIGRLLHGEAVGIGMVLALRFSAALGHGGAGEASRLEALLAKAGLPTSLAQAGVPGEALVRHMASDKKNEGAGLTLILAHGIGQAFVARGVPAERVRAFLATA